MMHVPRSMYMSDSKKRQIYYKYDYHNRYGEANNLTLT